MVSIAVVGMGCRFPGGVHDGPSFWEFLTNKGDGIVDVPKDRWDADRFYDPDPDAPGRMYTRRGGFLTQSLWDFDPEFFGMSPREAAVTDPQQRLLLEVAWEALDDAGHAGRVSGRNVGVYVGGFTNDSAGLRNSAEGRPFVNAHSATSSSHTLLSNRVSFALDLQGPSMTIDTACSSSLVAIHEAVSALERGECEMALVGGANTMLRPETFISMCKGRFLSVDGRSKSFDAAADGYGRGEGAGMVLLRPLADAQRDGDRIYSVIKGSGANQDGRTIAIPVPNPVAQQSLATRVCAEAGIDPAHVAYVEAHGTGTAVGDPIEIEALGGAYGTAPGRTGKLIVGSVKANIGHTEAAAGIAGIIKAALTVHHRTIAPQGWLDTLNPAIPFDDLAIRIPVETEPFPDTHDVAIVAVNGFGYGGTNAHVVMQQAPTAPTPVPRPALQLFPISARTEAAAREMAGLYLDNLGAGAGFEHAAWTRRAHLPVRATIAYRDEPDLAEGLRSFAAGTGSVAHILTTDAAQPVFVFSGMGPQWWGMARELLAAGGEFARAADVIDEAFIEIAGWSIVEQLGKSEDESIVSRTDVAQPANFLVQVALVAELRSLGISPDVVVGHSVGEVSAAYVSGALTLRDALSVSYHRARLQATTAGTGSMLAVGLSEDAVRTFIAAAPELSPISVAAVNSKTSLTLAGDEETLDLLDKQFAEAGIFAKKLKVEVPYHSHLMDPILGDVREVLADLDPQVPTTVLFSTVDAQQVTGATWDAAYWADNVRKPVRFAETITELVGKGHRIFLEIGPHPVLSGNIREILLAAGEQGTSIPTLLRSGDDAVNLQTAVRSLYSAGAFDGSGTSTSPAPHVQLPTYPWQRTRVWTEDAASIADRFGGGSTFPMLGDRTAAAAPEWQVELSVTQFPWLHDHVVDGVVVLPGAAYLDAALSAAAVRTGHRDVAAEDVRFIAPLVIDAHDVPVLQISVEDATRRFSIRSRSATAHDWTVNATGRLVEGHVDEPLIDISPEPAAFEITGDALYPLMHAMGLHYGPAFRRIDTAAVGSERVVANLVTRPHQDAPVHLTDPTTVDAALQCVAALARNSGAGAVVPAHIHHVRRYGDLPDSAVVVVSRTGEHPLRADIAITDADGVAAVTMTGVEFAPIAPPRTVLQSMADVFYEPVWELRDHRPGLVGNASPVASDFGLVVVLGSGLPRAAHRATALAASRTHSVIVNAAHTSPAALTAALRTGMSLDGITSATIMVVASELPRKKHIGTAADLVYELVQVARTMHAAIYGDLDGPALPPGAVSGVIVTERAFCMPGDRVLDTDSQAQAALVGARRSLRNEQSPGNWRLVDTDEYTDIDQVVTESYAFGDYAHDVADEVALRQGSRWVVKVSKNLGEHLAVRSAPRIMVDPEESFVVEAPQSKLLADLALRAIPRVAPGPHEIEIRMNAIGLNYKDPLKVMGVLTDRELAGTYFGTTLGLEGAGTVTRVGSEVVDIVPGDRMGVCARNMMKRYLTLDPDEAGTMRMSGPRGNPAHSSSTLPYLCAHFGLIDLARVQPGETVLIHGAAGGMGLAAIQVALLLGARVIATAGTEERRAVALAAGAHEVLASRSLNYSEDVMRLTGGRGVDVVFNSSPGEIMAQNLHVAAEFGRIVEIGKADIYFGGVMDLKPFDRNLSFFAVDMDRMLEHRPAQARAITRIVLDCLADGTYRYLPYTEFPLSRIGDAFDSVIRSAHTGRVVLSFDDEAQPRVLPETPVVRIDPDASYIVTGGFGAFGLAVARWLVSEGARHLVLIGRNGATTDAARTGVEQFESAGVDVTHALLDISDYDAVLAVIAATEATGHPVRGVFHTAGVVDNLSVGEITEESLQALFEPKVTGAQNLDRALRAVAAQPDIFVLFSSMSSLTGGAPQIGYSAANSALDALAWGRRSRGEPALTISWGAMSGGGMAESEQVVRYLGMLGFGRLDMDAATLMMRECLTLDIAHAALVILDWEQWGVANPASVLNPRFAEHIAAASTGGSGISALHAEILALPEEQRGEVLTFILAEQLALVMGIDADAVDVQTPLPDLGLDSLMAVEFAARVGKTMGLEISVLEFGRGQGLAGIGAKLAAGLTAKSEAARVPVAPLLETADVS